MKIELVAKSPYRHAEHKLNEGPPRDDSCVISCESVHKCKRSSILKKVYEPNKHSINKQLTQTSGTRPSNALLGLINN